MLWRNFFLFYDIFFLCKVFFRSLKCYHWAYSLIVIMCRVDVRKTVASTLLCVSIVFVFFILSACSNSADADEQYIVEMDELLSSAKSSSSVKSSSSKNKVSSSSYGPFKPNNKEFPYAGIPRIEIETVDRLAIEDRETEIPAKLLIWGEKKAESDTLDLTIRGRGNTSWLAMPKKSYKIEFAKKQSLLGMPKDKDWALIANYADKTLMKNYLMYHLSADLGAYYSPRCEFAELYLNGEYLGVYLVTETIKIGTNRINAPKDSSYIVEFDEKYRKNEQVFFSELVTGKSYEKPYRVHDPKNASEEVLSIVENHVRAFETAMIEFGSNKENNIEKWIDIDEYVKHFWLQEFSKNPDSRFYTSVYFSWTVGDVIKMGPVWDFDIAFGGNSLTEPTEDWYTRESYWNIYVFRDTLVRSERAKYWKENKNTFSSVLTKIDSVRRVLNDAAKNNFKKWDVLQSTEYDYHRHSYTTYKEAAEDLKTWIKQRIKWIDSQMQDVK